MELFGPDISLDDTIKSWLTAIFPFWRLNLRAKGYSEDSLIDLIKKKAYSSLKKDEFNFSWIYRMEDEIKDMLLVDAPVKIDEETNEIVKEYKTKSARQVRAEQREQKQRDYEHERLTKIARKFKCDLSQAQNIINNKRLKREQRKILKQIEQEQNNKKKMVFALYKGKELEFKQLKYAVKWYSNKFKKSEGQTKGIIFTGIYKKRECNFGVTFYKK